MTATRPCFCCGMELENACGDDSENYQPYQGGTARFTFCFGSTDFDLAPGCTVYLGVVCDTCAHSFVGRMECELYDMTGKTFSPEDFDGPGQSGMDELPDVSS